MKTFLRQDYLKRIIGVSVLFGLDPGAWCWSSPRWYDRRRQQWAQASLSCLGRGTWILLGVTGVGQGEQKTRPLPPAPPHVPEFWKGLGLGEKKHWLALVQTGLFNDCPEVVPLSAYDRKAMVLPGSWLRTENGHLMKQAWRQWWRKSSCLIFVLYLSILFTNYS